MTYSSKQVDKHIDKLARVYGEFQPDPEVVQYNTDLKDDAFLAWRRIQENAARRNKEYRGTLEIKIKDIIRPHAKKSWFNEARPTSRDLKKALLPFNPGMLLFPRPFSLLGFIKWLFSSSASKRPVAFIIENESSNYVFYKIREDLVVAVDEHDVFSPIQIRINGGLIFESEPFASIERPNNGWSESERDIYVARECMQGHSACVVVNKGRPHEKSNLSLGSSNHVIRKEFLLHSDTEGQRRAKLDSEEAQSIVLNALVEALGRKAVRSLCLLSPALGTLRPSASNFAHPLLKKIKNVDPYKHYCDVTPREYEDRFTTREPVEVSLVS